MLVVVQGNDFSVVTSEEELRSGLEVFFGIVIADLEIFTAVCVWVECIECGSAAANEIFWALLEWFDRE